MNHSNEMCHIGAESEGWNDLEKSWIKDEKKGNKYWDML